jgi:hypothetical protein
VQATAPKGSAVAQTEGRVYVALFLGFASLSGLVFPPAIGLGVAGIVLSLMARKRIATSAGRLRGQALIWIALGLSVLGILLSLVLPGFVVYVWIYALSHGGQLPGLTGPSTPPNTGPPSLPGG